MGYSSRRFGICDYLSYLRLERIGSEPQITHRTQMYGCAARPSVQIRAIRGSFVLLMVASITAKVYWGVRCMLRHLRGLL